MIVYNETKKKFCEDVLGGYIESIINEKIEEVLHKHTSQSEVDSWMNSLTQMYMVVGSNPKIPNDASIAIEYRIPNSNKRVDFIVAGQDKHGKDSAVVIELKQWQNVFCTDEDGIVETYLGGGLRQTTHPSYQAWAYVSLIEDYNESVRKYQINLQPCTYLHNYDLKKESSILDSKYQYYIDKAPVFTKGDAKRLSDFIAQFIHKGNPDVMYHIECGKIIPSKSLQDNMTSLLKGNKEFTLIDEQKVIYENILGIASKNYAKKQVCIIHGGPGTGKTVLAINLLVDILNLSKNCLYVTKNAAVRSVYTKKLTDGKYRKTFVDNLFKGSGSFTDCQEDVFDCLIVDEAHRLNAKSGLFSNLGENQIKEIIQSSKLAVFFVDDHQMVTLKDIGSTEEIKKWCKYFEANVYEDTMISQFRCNGSDSYLSWIDNVLEINTESMVEINKDYDIRICDSPQEVRQLIYEKNEVNNKSRMVAGYCWDWISNGKNNSDVHDIVIGDFEMSWNLQSSNTWAIDPKSVNEIGCIHTCQGLEFDYVGVIIGDDMTYDENHIQTHYERRAKTDQSIKGIKKLFKENKEQAIRKADEIIKNTYRTLMTRGQKGCFVYCTDQKLNEYLKNRLK